MLPDYIAKAVSNPTKNRAPWYKNTAPSYAGVFLWVAYYQFIAKDTIDRAGVGLCLVAIAIGALLSYALYYLAPGMLGMKTGYPLYVVGSSTFGTKGYLMPGLLMGVLQIGWFAVATSLGAQFILRGLQMDPTPGTLPFVLIAIVWGYTFAVVGALGIQYVSRVSIYLNLIPFLMILVGFFKTSAGLAHYTPKGNDPFAAFTLLIAVVIGFFATAGAAGADFGMSNRNEKDIRMGGLVGIALAALYAGGLPLLSVAGAHGLHPEMQSFSYGDTIGAIGGALGTAMFFLFAIASITPSCICAFIAGNSFSTMIPRFSRFSSTLVAMTVSVILAATGVADNLIGFFTIVGASFGPICGAMAADYLLSGKKWAGPREGINFAGYISWAVGFVIGILPFLPIPAEIKAYTQPAVLYSFIAGFVLYLVLAKAGLEPKVVPMTKSAIA